MKEPMERKVIRRKIKSVMRTKGNFTREDCVMAYFGDHFEEDWQECLNEMVEERYLAEIPSRYEKVKK